MALASVLTHDDSQRCIRVSEKTTSETVWKLGIGLILKSHEREDRDQQALFGRRVLPETTFNEPSSYFPDSLTRLLGE